MTLQPAPRADGFFLNQALLDTFGYLFGLAAFIWPPLAVVALLIALLNLWRGRVSPAIAQWHLPAAWPSSAA